MEAKQILKDICNLCPRTGEHWLNLPIGKKKGEDGIFYDGRGNGFVEIDKETGEILASSYSPDGLTIDKSRNYVFCHDAGRVIRETENSLFVRCNFSLGKAFFGGGIYYGKNDGLEYIDAIVKGSISVTDKILKIKKIVKQVGEK